MTFTLHVPTKLNQKEKREHMIINKLFMGATGKYIYIFFSIEENLKTGTEELAFETITLGHI